MTNLQAALLAIEVSILLLVMLVLVSKLFDAKQERYKFRLYAIRDQLIYLVSTGELAEESFLFQLLYTTINATIAEVRGVDRWSFIRAATTARTALEQAKINTFLHELLGASPAVRKVAGDFIDTMLEIVKANSPFTKLCVYFLRRFKQGQDAFKKRPSFMPKEQYENYRCFGKLSHDYHLKNAA